MNSRILVGTLLGAALVLSACGGSGSSSGSGGGKRYKIVYVQGIAGNPFYTSVSCGAQEEAQKLGVDFSFQGATTFGPPAQIQILDAVTAAKPDAILISITDPKAMIPPLQAAKDNGAKIVAVDGDLEDKSIAVTNIQSNNVQGGMLAGERMAELTGGKGKVMSLANGSTSPVTVQRLQGFADAIKKHPGMTYLGPQYTANATAKAASAVSSTIAANPDLVGVFAASTNNTEGAATGVQEAGKKGVVKVIGYDTSDPIVADIRSGVVDADVVQYPVEVGRQALRAAVAALKGEKVQRNIETPFVIATPKNIDSAEVQKYVYKTHC